jgi:hypothetical protein
MAAAEALCHALATISCCQILTQKIMAKKTTHPIWKSRLRLIAVIVARTSRGHKQYELYSTRKAYGRDLEWPQSAQNAVI